MYCKPPYFTSARDRDVWLSRARSTPSHPHGHRHVVSLLTTWSAIEHHVLQRRRDLLGAAEQAGTLHGWREAVLNKRDYPLMRKVSVSASAPPREYDALPVFSQYVRADEYDDLPMPALADWQRAHPHSARARVRTHSTSQPSAGTCTCRCRR